MTSVDQTAQERRTGTQELVEKLTNERAEVFILFNQVAGLQPYTSDKPIQKLLQEFCQVLIDYIAAGHFTLYERILNGTERRQGVVRLAEKLYPRIAKTSDSAVEFNDKYDCEDHCEKLDTLWSDLSRLGEELATRIELEDQLTEALQIQ